MKLTIFDAFEDLFSGVKIDEKLAKGLYNFRVGYITQNREHMEFFGGNLLGVNIVRFKDSDVNRFFELMNLEYVDVHRKVREITTIDHSFKVASDPMNLTFMYLIHKYINSRICNDTIKKKVTKDLALIFFYRCSAALLSANFKYPADPKVAQMAYANLSQKYLIKKLGSWNKVMDYRADALLSKESPHVKTFKFFNNDLEIQYSVSDSQSRIREMFKGYYSEFMMVHESGGSVGVIKSIAIDAEGEESIREKTTGPENFVFYMRSIITDPPTFIRDDLLGVIAKNNSNTSTRAVKGTLEWICYSYSQTQHNKLLDDFITRVVVQAVYFIDNNIESSKRRDLSFVMTQLKNLFLSTRSVDPDLFHIREVGEKIITLSNGKLSTSLMMATRTAVVMYICLRSLVGKNTK